MSGPDRIALGKEGEEIACAELKRLGYEILDRRYRTRFGEIDIIARDGRTLAFVEVKARLTSRYGSPAEAVTLAKQARIGRMATEYLLAHGGFNQPCRFDVVSILLGGDGSPAVEVFQNAFEVDG
ncbi:MAG: YraN family protein [Vicinamibacterales bacterium]